MIKNTILKIKFIFKKCLKIHKNRLRTFQILKLILENIKELFFKIVLNN